MNKADYKSESGDAYSRIEQLGIHIPGVIYQFHMMPDGQYSFPFATGGMLGIYGVTPEQVREDGSIVFSRIHPDDVEVARKIRAKETRRIPILLLHSISDDSELAETCRDASICLSLSKPIKATLLHQMLMDLEGYMTRFRPGQHVAEQPDESAKDVSHSQGPFVVLIAEDIPMNMILTRTLVQQILGDVIVLEATDGIQVLDLMRKHTVDLILMDVLQRFPG